MNWGDERLPIKFWSMARECGASGCWLWAGGATSAGYGRIRLNGKDISTHRAVVIAEGRDPAGLDVDHLCRNRLCCNPAHLDIVTRGENVRRGLKGALCTQCPRGHIYEAANIRRRADGRRDCRTCHRDSQRARYHKAAEGRATLARLDAEDAAGQVVS